MHMATRTRGSTPRPAIVGGVFGCAAAISASSSWYPDPACARYPNPERRAGQPYYLVRISTTAEEIKRLNGLKLVPGMPVEAFIQTEERTMLSYLLKPLTDQARRAFREK
jgi:multidrug efflux pump subunit AcrA (membrane-fusion protein)